MGNSYSKLLYCCLVLTVSIFWAAVGADTWEPGEAQRVWPMIVGISLFHRSPTLSVALA